MLDCLELARLERPDSGFEARLLDSIHKAVRAKDAVETRPAERRVEWIFPAWRWAAAACLIAAIGIWVTRRHPLAGAGGGPQASLQSAAPVFDFHRLLPASAFPDPSPPSAAAGSFSLADSNRTERTNLYLIRFEP